MGLGFDWVAQQAARRSDEVAVATADTGFRLTWAELEQRVARLAHLLASDFGVGPGDRVALLAESDARYFEIQFASIRLGAIFVPLNVRLSAVELKAVLDDCAPRVLIHDQDNAAAAAAASDRLPWDCGPAPSPYDAVRDPQAATVAARRLDPAAVAQIMYTSGTTGRPKGVLITNEAMAAHAVNMGHTSRCADRDAHALNFVPLFHAGGLNIFCNPVLYWGGRVTTTRGFDALQVLALLCDASLGATISAGVLQMYERIADLAEFDHSHFPTMRVALFGGFGPDALRTHRKWLGRGPVLQLGYGSTELGPMACMNQNPDDGALSRGEFGIPVPLTELHCVDESGVEVPAGEIGEIEVRGPSVTAGYWNVDDQAVKADGWFSIGDVGYLDTGGSVHVTGRLVERYRSGGENIYPAEVEAAYIDLPGVIELAVTGVPDARWGEVGLLVIVPHPGLTFTLEEVRRHAEGKLARFKLPHHVQLVAALPRSTTLKVARNELRAAFVRDTAGDTPVPSGTSR